MVARKLVCDSKVRCFFGCSWGCWNRLEAGGQSHDAISAAAATGQLQTGGEFEICNLAGRTLDKKSGQLKGAVREQLGREKLEA